MTKNICAILISFVLFSCTSYRPILDENDRYINTPQEQSKADVDACLKKADEYLKQYKKNRIIKEAGRKAVIGAVIGAASTVLFGSNLKSIAIGTAVGAGIGGAAGGLMVAGEDKVTPSQIKQRYVINCLARDGYSVIGWE